MWTCNNCKINFYFPVEKKPDAGFTHPVGILGMRTIEPVKFCPGCMSTNIEKEESQ